MKLFTDSDLDGLGCALVAKIAFGEDANVDFCTYHNLNQRVQGYLANTEKEKEQVYITDLSVNKDMEKKLNERFKKHGNVQMVDHHQTALHFNEYEWGFVKVEYDDDRKTCATSLFYDFLREKGEIDKNPVLEDFIELVRQYDTWEWEQNNNEKAKRLNDLFSIIGREKFENEMLSRLQEKGLHEFSFNELEENVLELEEKRIDRYIRAKNRRMVQTFIHDFCVGIVHGESYLSELGNELNKRNPHLDLIAILNVGNKSMGFRTIHDHVDVSEFAKGFGGGGHAKAAGCGLTEETFTLFVADTFHLVPRRPEPEKNEFNLPKNPAGTFFLNRGNEQSIIFNRDGKWQVVHQQVEANAFETYEEAERYVKRSFAASLEFDNDLFKQMVQTFKVKEEELKENYKEWQAKLIQEVITI